MTGAQQRYVVPTGVGLLAVVVQGGFGGAWGGGPGHYVSTPTGQAGAAFGGLLPVNGGEVVYVEVGSDGTVNGGRNFGGGGPAGRPDAEGAEAASGGGASDIRTCSEDVLRCPGGAISAATRLIVAGGAGAMEGPGSPRRPVCSAAAAPAAVRVNSQPLPNGMPSLGPVPVEVPGGTVIPGFASDDDPGPRTVEGMTDAAGGSDVAGSGGHGTSCDGGGAYQGDVFSGAVAGSPGSGPDGGTGGNAAGMAPPLACTEPGRCSEGGPGGGGGGGYFGGGGGATGYPRCHGPQGPCGNVTASVGGGAGSSFISRRVLYPSASIAGLLGSGVPYIRMTPVAQVLAPAEGAIYQPHELVRATWSCSGDPGWGNGVQNCTATAAAGSPIDTTPGTHTFTVRGIGHSESQPISVSVTYSVR